MALLVVSDIAGIHRFWEEHMTPEKFKKYISHIRKVIPEIIRLEGQATGMWKLYENMLMY